MKKTFFTIFILLFFCTWQYAQRIKNEDKIDPTLRSLLVQQKLQNKKKWPSEKVKDSKRGTPKNASTARKFECIIYTKNAKALKDKGIVINSTLATFVTAIVTLEQIEQLASMDEVTYIEAAKNNYPNR
jgi:minor extracellular serine protease Vpr